MKVHGFCFISCVSRHPAPNWQHLRPRFLRRRHEVAGMPIHTAQDGFNLAWHCPLNLPMWAAQGPQEGPKGSGVQQASAPGQGTSHNWTPQPVAAKGLWAKPREPAGAAAQCWAPAAPTHMLEPNPGWWLLPEGLQ